MNAIEMIGVNKSFGDFSIRNLSFCVPEGCICGLVGENGAGKSTVIRMLMGALRADSGEIRTLDTDVRSADFCRMKQDIGVVLDDAWLPEVLSAIQVGVIMRRTYTRWDEPLYERYLSRFSLPKDKAMKDYSRGMRMKLAIAVALSHHPRLLVLDEATAGLDPVVRDEVLELFYEFTREEDHSILISSHILSDLEKLCDYIAFLHEGRLLFCEEKDVLLEDYGIFAGMAAEADALDPAAVIHREGSGMGGVRALVRRGLVSPGIPLEKPSVEDVILNMVKGETRK